MFAHSVVVMTKCHDCSVNPKTGFIENPCYAHAKSEGAWCVECQHFSKQQLNYTVMRCVACSHKLHSRGFTVSGGHIDGGLPAVELKSDIPDGKMNKKMQLFQAVMTQRQYAIKAMTEQVKQLADLHNAFMNGLRGFEKELTKKDMPARRHAYENADKVAEALHSASEALHSFKAEYDEFIPSISETFDMTEDEQERFFSERRVKSQDSNSRRRMSYESTEWLPAPSSIKPIASGAPTAKPPTYDAT